MLVRSGEASEGMLAVKQVAVLPFVLMVVLQHCAFAQGAPVSTSSREAEVRSFLMAYVTSDGTKPRETRYSEAFIDLNGDGIEEAVVYLAGPDWCGSSGCVTLVLTPAGRSYQLVGKILATRPPIRVLRRSDHGWRALTAWVAGGGILTEYEAELRFDGKRYPISAAPPTSPRLSGKPDGAVVIPASANDATNEKVLIAGAK